MKLIMALTATLIYAAIGCAAASTAPGRAGASSASALSGHILYTTSAPGDVQTFWRIDRAGTARLTEPGAYCCLHRISPDHRRLLVMPGDDSLLGDPPTGGTLTLRDLQYTRLRPTDPLAAATISDN